MKNRSIYAKSGVPGRTFAFIMDEMGQYVSLSGERLEYLRDIVEQFGRESLKRMKAGKIPGPAWIVVTAWTEFAEVSHLPGSQPHNRLAQNTGVFQSQIDLTPTDIREVVARRVLRKKTSQEFVLRKLFRDSGASLIQNLKLERSSRRTGVRRRSVCPVLSLSSAFDRPLPGHRDRHSDRIPTRPNTSAAVIARIIKQSFEMLVSDRTRFLRSARRRSGKHRQDL